MADWNIQPDDSDENLDAGMGLLKRLSAWSLVEEISEGVWRTVGPLAGNSNPGAGSLTQQQIPEDGVTRDCHRDWY